MSPALAFGEPAKKVGKRFVGWAGDSAPVWYGYGLIGRVHARRCDVQRNIVVSGGPRSGTTWLMEMIGGITGYVWVNEPEMPIPAPKVKRHLGYNLAVRIYQDPDVEDEAFTQALHRILSGSYIRPSSIRRNATTAIALLRGTPLVVKFVRANLYLPYLRSRFPNTKIVQIVRDPYAVIASQMSHPIQGWKDVKRIASFYTSTDALAALIPPLAFDHPEEILAAHWCLDHAWLAKNLDGMTGVHLIRYEDLYNQPENALRSLVAYLEREWDERYLALVGKRSRSVRPGSALLAKSDPTTSYKRSLTDEHQQRIAHVLGAFDYPFCRPS